VTIASEFVAGTFEIGGLPDDDDASGTTITPSCYLVTALCLNTGLVVTFRIYANLNHLVLGFKKVDNPAKHV
jgi:hypothetical protein